MSKKLNGIENIISKELRCATICYDYINLQIY